VDHLPERRERAVSRDDVLEHVLLELADAVLHRLEEELFLVAEVVVDRALRDARVARDAVDGGALVAQPSEAIDRRGHELLARRLRSLGARAAAPCRHTDRSVSSVTRLVNPWGVPSHAVMDAPAHER